MIPKQYRRDPTCGRAIAWGPLYRRHFPERTDPTSRHTKVIAECILRDPASPVRRMLIDEGYEPDHWAEALEQTVRMLWEARERIEQLQTALDAHGKDQNNEHG